MLIDGNSMDEVKTLSVLREAKGDDECFDLELQRVELDHELTSLLIQVIQSKMWQSMRLSLCRGRVCDVVTACMSHQVKSLFLQTSINCDIMNALAYGLNYSKSLISLQLMGEISVVDASNFARAVARNVCLEELDLSDCAISTSSLGVLVFALRINRTIKSISFDGCYLEDENLAHFLSALQDSPALQSLSVQRNYCHDKSMSMISSLLHYNNIKELNMSYLLRKKKETQTEVVQEDEDEPDRSQAESLQGEASNEVMKDKETESDNSTRDCAPDLNQDEKLREEEDAEPAIEPESGSEPEPETENYAHNTSLRNLQLAGNGLNDGFIESMLRILGKDSAMEVLNLFGNRMTDLSMRRIIAKLPLLKKLKSLWIGHNNFTIAGYKALLLAVENNFTLERLGIVTINTTPEVEEIQKKIDYYTRLNRGGRRIFSSDVSTLPKSIWPLVLERANKVKWGDGEGNDSKRISCSADSIFCLLQGPALLDVS